MSLVFIDESGDVGLKIESGSSPYFVVTLVVFQNEASARSADNTIANLRTRMGVSENFEFHFSKISNKHRLSFFKEVNGIEFSYYSIVINKRGLTGPGFSVKESFYKYACKLVLTNAAAALRESTVVLDGCGSREFKRELCGYLRRAVNNPAAEFVAIKKLKLQESHRNNLIQLADMVCGAVGRSFSDRPDKDEYRKWLRPREKRVQFWPK
ncbi:MAG TPA: DUF3800 domain-containing protein [Opitutaceae bacterium]|nr:DUF3800 domain-containing protein [Opitutaceae bacterium]